MVVPRGVVHRVGSTGRFTNWKLPIVCAVCAALPDIDLLYMPTHRTATHSVPVAVLLTILAVVVTGWVNPIRDWAGRRFSVGTQTFVIGLACALAWSSHILLDWLGADANPPYGVQAFWPFSDTWFYSGVDVFPGTQRRNPLSASAMLINLRAAVQEKLFMGAVMMAVVFLRTVRSGRGGRHDRAGGAGRAGRAGRALSISATLSRLAAIPHAAPHRPHVRSNRLTTAEPVR